MARLWPKQGAPQGSSGDLARRKENKMAGPGASAQPPRDASVQQSAARLCISLYDTSKQRPAPRTLLLPHSPATPPSPHLLSSPLAPPQDREALIQQLKVVQTYQAWQYVARRLEEAERREKLLRAASSSALPWRRRRARWLLANPGQAVTDDCFPSSSVQYDRRDAAPPRVGLPAPPPGVLPPTRTGDGFS